MFDALAPRGRPPLNSPADKQEWMTFLEKLGEARKTGTVGDVLDLCLEQRLFDGLGKVRERHRKAVSPPEADPQAVSDDNAEARVAARAKEYQQLREVPYAELLALNEHLGGGTSFVTQHSVKGLEFTQVLAVVSKGRNRFQIPEMLANFSRRHELVGEAHCVVPLGLADGEESEERLRRNASGSWRIRPTSSSTWSGWARSVDLRPR
jgi:DNA helicase-2/ATP-dependent DNA helicase PcrA